MDELSLYLTESAVPVFELYVNTSPVSKLWFGMYIDFEGTKSSLIPAPGLENDKVVPIPTPTETDSEGSKYNSVFRFILSVVWKPAFIVNLLCCSKRVVVTVWADPVVPFWPLKTLSLDLVGSGFRTFICSVPILNISFGFAVIVLSTLK